MFDFLKIKILFNTNATFAVELLKTVSHLRLNEMFRLLIYYCRSLFFLYLEKIVNDVTWPVSDETEVMREKEFNKFN